MNTNYKLIRDTQENKIVSNFKKSILGTEVGIKSDNFIAKIVTSLLLVIAIITFMYFNWKI